MPTLSIECDSHLAQGQKAPRNIGLSRPALIRCATALAASGWLWFGAVSLATAQSPDVRFASGLRARGLHDLSARACRERLAASDLGAAEQADLLVQLAQSLVARAASLSLVEQPAAWAAARAALADFLRDHPDHPRREVLLVQNALTLLAQGESARREWELTAEQGMLSAQAAEVLRQAVAEFEAADRAIADGLPQRQRRQHADELSTEQLLALQTNVQFQLAQCHLNVALLYGEDAQATRVDALAQIERRLDQLVRRVSEDHPLRTRIELLRVQCQRRLGQWAEARARLSSLEPATMVAEARSEYWNEHIQLALAQGQIERILIDLPKVADFYASDPQLCLSLVEVFLAASRQTTNPRERETWQQRAEQTIRILEANHGSYWTRRANLLLLTSAARTESSASEGLVFRMVDELARKGQADQGLELLDLAASQAQGESRMRSALALAFRAAELQQQRGNHQDAADRFRILAAAHVDQPEAAAGHLAACWNMAQLIPRQPERVGEYAGLLREHLERWPTDPTSDQAAAWLIPLLNRQAEWREAFSVAAGVRPIGSEFSRAAAWGAAAALAELDRVASAEPNHLESRATDIERALAQWIERVEGSPSSDDGTALGWLQLSRAIVAIRYLDRDSAAIERELEALLRAATRPDTAWLHEAQAWRALCRAAQGNAIPGAEIGLLDPAFSGRWLSSVQRRRTSANKAAISQLILDQGAALESRWTRGDEDIRVRWQIALAESRWALGDPDRAAADLAALAKERPRLLDAQLSLARMLSSDSAEKWADEAIVAWRAVAAGSPPRGPIWFESKLELARLLVRTGKSGDAEKLLLYLRTVPPGWNESGWRREFERLLAEIQGSAK
jgi:hypothetical protein